MNFTKTQKYKYPEKETLFLFQIKKFINCASVAKNSFVGEVTFNDYMFYVYIYIYLHQNKHQTSTVNVNNCKVTTPVSK